MIGVTRDGHVTVIELRRPEKRNAINVATIKELTTAFENVANDEETRAVVLTGQGTSFCAGADLSDADPVEGPKAQLKLLRLIEETAVPVIAAINGPAVGAGVQLTLVCDLRVVDKDAFIQVPTGKIGVVYDPKSIRRLVDLVGAGATRTLLYTAEKLTAEQTLHYGFANKIGDLDAALELARHVASLAPLSLKLTKKILREDFDRPVPEELWKEAEALLFSEDVREALVARFEKRQPVFKGK